MLRVSAIITVTMMLMSSTLAQQPVPPRDSLDAIAESYVKLALKLGAYDPDFIDAYFGPESWKPTPPDSGRLERIPRAELNKEATDLLARLAAMNLRTPGTLEQQRLAYLKAHLASLKGRIDLVSSRKMSFDEESKVLYDAVAPQYSVDTFEVALKELDRVLPGSGNLTDRYEAYRKAFMIPKDRIDTVFKTAIAEARRRTLRHIALPPDERFTVELVTGQPWGAYNWYKGENHSLIQVNTDLPVYIDAAVGLACHEGYPGHHVQNVLVDTHLSREKHWVEFCVYPLFCPMGLLNEGGANFAVDLAFPDSERVAFERDTLFPLAGLDSSRAEEYHRVLKLTERVRGAGVEAARRYLDGHLNKEETVAWLKKYGLQTTERAERSVRFYERYRSYVINYRLGEDLVKKYIEKNKRGENGADRSWDLLRDLFAIPHTPSDLL